MYISLDKLLHNQKWINEPFELKDLWRQSVTKSPKPLSLSHTYPFLIWQSSCICLWLLLTYEIKTCHITSYKKNIFHKLLC